MTDREKAIVMAYTGKCMLTGNKFQIFHKYVEDIMGRPIWTHEMGLLADEIKGKSEADFMALCAEQEPNTGHWIDVKDRVPEEYGEYLITWTGVLGANSTKRSEPLISIAEYEIYEPENYEDWITTDNEFRYYHDIKVLAWQELPEPYEVEPQESEVSE